MKLATGLVVLLGATAVAVAARAVPPEHQQHDWLDADGERWRRLSPEARTAYTEGFLVGAALGQAASGIPEGDTAAVRRTLDSLERSGLRLPYAPNVYMARIDDYFWWENHRPYPIWHAFEEVNHDLKRMSR
ncbi:MAG TPA: hypothetical protein VLT17_04755 [Gemmatimonadales bacterium]|nr:hypothetical protein [Gemmatimonadales bacterium]